MQCPNGHHVEAGDRFCVECGATVDPEAAAAPATFDLARLTPRATLIVVFLVVQIAIRMWSATNSWSLFSLASDVLAGKSVDPAHASAIDDARATIAGANVLFLVATAVVWVMWQYRAHRNVHKYLGRHLKTSPALAAGGWFIPFANIVLPFRAMSELTKATGALHGSTSSTSVVPLWWTTYIAGGVFAFIGFNDTTVAEIRRGAAFRGASDILAIISALLAILIVRAISSAQDSLQGAPVPADVSFD
jgi:hypothetical protein